MVPARHDRGPLKDVTSAAASVLARESSSDDRTVRAMTDGRDLGLHRPEAVADLNWAPAEAAALGHAAVELWEDFLAALPADLIGLGYRAVSAIPVDDAVGAVGALVGGLRDRFAGIERADSISLDPHKRLYVPIACGMLLSATTPTSPARHIDPSYTVEDKDRVGAGVDTHIRSPFFTRHAAASIDTPGPGWAPVSVGARAAAGPAARRRRTRSRHSSTGRSWATG